MNKLLLCTLLIACGPGGPSAPANEPSTGHATRSCAPDFDRLATAAGRAPADIASDIVALAPTCGDELEPRLRELAFHWHNRAVRGQDPALAHAAEPLYQLYLERFPTADKAADARYFHAELRWQQAENEADATRAGERWQAAGAAFDRVVASGGLSDKIVREAAYASVLSWKNALGKQDRKPVASDRGQLTEQPIPALDQGLVSALQRYRALLQQNPQAPGQAERVNLLFLEARTYWRYFHLRAAVPLLEQIVEAHRDHETAEYALNLLLDALNLQKNYPRMAYWVNVALDDRTFLAQRQELAQRLRMIQQQMGRKSVEDMVAAGDHAGCARVYLQMYRATPTMARGDEVLYNAAVCTAAAGDPAQARTLFQELESSFPDSPLAPRAASRRRALR